MLQLIGREKEQKALRRLYRRHQADLVAIYGRRRVGKTFLVSQTFAGCFTFQHTGLSPAEDYTDTRGRLKEQLSYFYRSLLRSGMKEKNVPSNWMEAFGMLESFLTEKNDGSRQLVFLDELPWMDTPRSGFMTAFEAFWNGWACHQPQLMLIVCGSANSWIQNRLINNHGGLYDRVTYEIKLAPLSLKECESLYRENNIRFSRYDIAQAYMILGGIPYYLGLMEEDQSLAQNVDRLFFSQNAVLRNEYDRLFSSVFQRPESVKAIVQLLATKNAGYTRKEIVQHLKISDGGSLSEQINALITSDFVLKYVPFGFGKREEHYKLIDPFCIFFLHFVQGKAPVDHYWLQHQASQEVVSWRGIAFENVCFQHIPQIKYKLGISGVETQASAWSKRNGNDQEMQIDLLLLRADNVVNMCEIKYYGDDFTVTKEYYRLLLRRQELLAEAVSRKQGIQQTLITTFGLINNEYSGVFSNVICLDDLFL